MTLSRPPKPPKDPRCRLIITYTAGYVKTFLGQKVRMAKNDGISKGQGIRIKDQVDGNYGTVEGSHCKTLDEAKRRISPVNGKIHYGKTSPAYVSVVFWDENRQKHDITPKRMPESSPFTNVLSPGEITAMGYGYRLKPDGERKYTPKKLSEATAVPPRP